MKLLRGLQCMIDLETLDTTPWSVILSIGACKFSQKGIINHFYVNVDPQSCLDIGMSKSAETEAWWAQQSEEARSALEVDRVPIIEALQRFADWYGGYSIPTWGNGSNFDNIILTTAYKLGGMQAPWNFWHDRCFRTIRSLSTKQLVVDGTKHNAKDDAIAQAQFLIDLDIDVKEM